MNSDMSKRIMERWLPKRNSANDRATSVLPTPVGPRNKNEPTGRCGFFKPARERRNRRSLRYYALMQLVLDAEQFLGVPFLKRCDRNAGPARDHFFDIS